MPKLRIISTSSQPFKDRREAGHLLSLELEDLRGKKAIVLGIPSGGIVVAREVALALDAEMDIVLARKLRTPGHPELAMGSVAEDGKLFLNDDVVSQLGVDAGYIQWEKAQQIAEIARRSEFIRRVRPRLPLKGRVVVIIDDGVATGATLQAALWAARQEKPEKLIAALPVGSEETVRRLASDTDEMVCLRAPPLFAAVGQFYMRFEQLEDEDVVKILREATGRMSS